ncbi:hypothetical protein D1007_58989 [Hordeum vulgare]|nr:hypothetical protein D1007_58989 [Hordeum vulgare]
MCRLRRSRSVSSRRKTSSRSRASPRTPSSRVPYKSLCRFKRVSKPWLALCSAPDIRRRSPQTLSGLFHYGASGGLQFRNLSCPEKARR